MWCEGLIIKMQLTSYLNFSTIFHYQPLPEKHSLTIDRFDKEFLRFRQAALHRLLNRITEHPEVSKDEMLKSFLTLEHAVSAENTKLSLRIYANLKSHI